MLAYDEALTRILAAVQPTAARTLGVRESHGRVLANDLTVSWDFPDAPRSAMDGFAVQADAGPDYTIVSEVAAGGGSVPPLQRGQAAAIMTGGVVPDGADAVVRVEDCRTEGQALHVAVPIQQGDLINPTGSEARAGDLLARLGTVIGPSVFPALFCAGLTEIPVHRRPRVGLLVTGDEVREVEDGPARGAVFNTNAYILEAVCAGLGLPLESGGLVPDDLDATHAAVQAMAERCDVVVTSGGVSKGRYDHVGHLLREGDYDLLVQGTRMKPGRPMHVARTAGGQLVFGMPGYPASFLSNAFIYLVPALKKASGRADHLSRWLTVRLAQEMRFRSGRLYLNRGALDFVDGGWTVGNPGKQQASHFLSFAQADALVRMAPDMATGGGGKAVVLPTGTEVQALRLASELT